MLGVDDGKNRNRTGTHTNTRAKSEAQTRNQASPSPKSTKEREKTMDKGPLGLKDNDVNSQGLLGRTFLLRDQREERHEGRKVSERTVSNRAWLEQGKLEDKVGKIGQNQVVKGVIKPRRLDICASDDRQWELCWWAIYILEGFKSCNIRYTRQSI